MRATMDFWWAEVGWLVGWNTHHQPDSDTLQLSALLANPNLYVGRAGPFTVIACPFHALAHANAPHAPCSGPPIPLLLAVSCTPTSCRSLMPTRSLGLQRCMKTLSTLSIHGIMDRYNLSRVPAEVLKSRSTGKSWLAVQTHVVGLYIVEAGYLTRCSRTGPPVSHGWQYKCVGRAVHIRGQVPA